MHTDVHAMHEEICSSTLWALGIRLRPPGLTASVFTLWAISQTSPTQNWMCTKVSLHMCGTHMPMEAQAQDAVLGWRIDLQGCGGFTNSINLPLTWGALQNRCLPQCFEGTTMKFHNPVAFINNQRILQILRLGDPRSREWVESRPDGKTSKFSGSFLQGTNHTEILSLDVALPHLKYYHFGEQDVNTQIQGAETFTHRRNLC